MVWGMPLPKSFGQFWPDGKPEGDAGMKGDGWSVRLSAYYEAQTPEVKKTLFDYPDDGHGSAAHFYPGYVAGKFFNEVGTRESPDRPPFIPIQPHEPPCSFISHMIYRTLGAFIVLGNCLAVSETLKVIVEQLEPGVHQYFPIRVEMWGNRVYPEKYYTLDIRQYHDSFAPVESKQESFSTNSSGDYLFTDSARCVRGLAFSKLVFGGAHLWRERRLSGRITCLSDQLQAEIANAGLRVPKHYRMTEV